MGGAEGVSPRGQMPLLHATDWAWVNDPTLRPAPPPLPIMKHMVAPEAGP